MAARTTRARRTRSLRESDELGAMLRRMLRALVRRSADGDLVALEELAALRGHVDQALADACRQLHDNTELDHSWTMIGDAIGMTRQRAQQLAAKGRPA